MLRVEVCWPQPCLEATGVTIQVPSPCYWWPYCTKVTGSYAKICVFRCLLATSESFLRALTQRLLTFRNPKYGKSADTYADRGLTPSPDVKAKDGRVHQASRGQRLRWPSRLNELRSALISRAPFDYPD